MIHNDKVSYISDMRTELEVWSYVMTSWAFGFEAM